MEIEEDYKINFEIAERVHDYVISSDMAIVLRCDGHSFTKLKHNLNLDLPFDNKFTHAMGTTAHRVFKEFGADIAHTVSDEISLIWLPRTNGEHLYGGRTHKFCSLVPSFVSLLFNFCLESSVGFPIFDCKVFAISEEMVQHYLDSRLINGQMNAISMVHHYKFGHQKGLNKSTGEKLKEIDPALYIKEYSVENRMGLIFRNKEETFTFSNLTDEEKEQLPPQHNARLNPNMEYTRNVMSIKSEYPANELSWHKILRECEENKDE